MKNSFFDNLAIIGNGFDLHFEKINLSYNEHRNFCLKNTA